MKEIDRQIRTIVLILAGLFFFAGAASAQVSFSDSQIKSILQDRIERVRQSVGIVVAIVDPSGTRIITYGKAVQDASKVLDGDTIFEIGSVSKTFAATLLALMAEKKVLQVQDPLTAFLPGYVRVPRGYGRPISLLDLATHYSSLPQMPDNFTPADPQNPYADYTEEKLYAFLSQYSLRASPGATFEYSNLGTALLGHILARKSGMDFAQLLQEWVCAPLGMESTTVLLTPELETRFAAGYDTSLNPTSRWDMPLLAGAGGIRSSANDMARYLRAYMGLQKTPLSKAMEQAQMPLFETGVPGIRIALNWFVVARFGATIVQHSGQTGGHQSFVGFDRQKKLGVIVLSNSSNNIDDIGFHLLNKKFALAKIKTPKQMVAISVDPRVLDTYVGDYRLGPNFVLSFTREGNRLFVRGSGQVKFEVYPETEWEFFMTAVDARCTFRRGLFSGQIDEVVWRQNGIDQTARRIR